MRRGRQRKIASSRYLIDEPEADAEGAPGGSAAEAPVHRRRVRSHPSSPRRAAETPVEAPRREPRRERRRARRALSSEQSLPAIGAPEAEAPLLADAPLPGEAGADTTLVQAVVAEPADVTPGDDAPEVAAGEAPGELAAASAPPAEFADAVLLDRVRIALDGAQSATTQADFTLRNIGQELRAISQRQSSYESKAVLNSVFAYVIFCALIFGALYFIFDLRSAKNAVDERYFESELERQAERLTLLEAELDKYSQGSHLAFEVYQLIEQARHDEALERYTAVRDRIINPAEAAMLEARIGAVRWKLAEGIYREGLDFFGKANHEQARDAFFQSLSYQTESPYAHLLNYHLGRSLYELGDFQGARHYFEIALGKELPRDLEAEARYHYAVATENVGMDAEAFELYDAFLKRFRSYTEHADDVHKRMGRIERAEQRDRLAAQRAARERALQQKEAEGQPAKPE